MTKNTLLAAGLCGLTLFIAPAAMAQPAQAPCLQVGQIDGFSPIKGSGERAVVITDKAKRRYRVTLQGACSGLDFNMGVGIRVGRGAGTLSCVSKGDMVISRDPGTVTQQCPVSKVELYTAALEKADMAAAAAGKK